MVSVASEEAGSGPGRGSPILFMTNLSITAKHDKTRCTTVTKQLFGQGQSDHVHSLLMLACFPGATATASNVNFFIVKYLLLRHHKILQYSSKILLTKQFAACQLNQARIAITH